MLTGNTLHANLAGEGTLDREQYLKRAKDCANLVLDQGDPDEAVTLMANLLNKWPELRQPDWVIKMGHVIAKDGTEANIRAWINGFK